MASAPAYIIVGKGRWGARIHSIVAAEGRRASFAAQIRREPNENEGDYKSRLCKGFAASAAHIAWLCLPPGPHVPSLVQAALAASLHVIVEKPWLCSHEETSVLQEAAGRQGLKIGVHFEYCFLSEVESWRRDYEREAGLEFGGIFTVRSSDHLGVPAIHNLGSHLLAIHAYAVPRSGISAIRCDYESGDQRLVWLEVGKRHITTIDFLDNKEPIIQRFMKQFEISLDGAPFAFDLNFAKHVTEDIAGLIPESRGTDRV